MLMRGLPFRVGHHFASEIVDFAKAHAIRPPDFPFAQARTIYRQTLREMKLAEAELPMSEEEFRATLDPVSIVHNRATSGGPQPTEMTRMLGELDHTLAVDRQWVDNHRTHIDTALAKLDNDFKEIELREAIPK